MQTIGRLEPARRVLLYALVSVLVLGLGAVLLLAWLESARGRVFLRDKLAAGISGSMAGTMEIAELEEVGFRKVHARGVTFRDPDGEPAIEVDHVVVTYDPLQIFGNRFGFEHADIDGCHVRVHEGKDGEVNMDKLFASKKPKKPEKDEEAKKERSEIDLRGMSTSACVLDIGGGSLPGLRMKDLTGIMRVRVLPDGKTKLAFDDYRGTFDKGLPTGTLVFREVRGWVEPGMAKLLHFDGTGRSEGSPVDYTLDILREPKKRVKIDARFPSLTANAVRTLAVAGFTAFSDTLDIDVHAGK